MRKVSDSTLLAGCFGAAILIEAVALLVVGQPWPGFTRLFGDFGEPVVFALWAVTLYALRRPFRGSAILVPLSIPVTAAHGALLLLGGSVFGLSFLVLAAAILVFWLRLRSRLRREKGDEAPLDRAA